MRSAREKIEHSKARRLFRGTAHQFQRLFGSQRRISGRSPASTYINVTDRRHFVKSGPPTAPPLAGESRQRDELPP